MERLWREFDGLPRPALDDIPEPVPAWRLPRALAAAFFVFCALLVATLFWRDQSLGPNLAYGTAPGEQREVVLADGSKLFLDVDTQVQVRYAERTRDVLLKKGEVFFVVSHDPVSYTHLDVYKRQAQEPARHRPARSGDPGHGA